MPIRLQSAVAVLLLTAAAACTVAGPPPLLSPRMAGSSRMTRMRAQAPPSKTPPRKQVLAALRGYLAGKPLVAGGYSFSGDPVGLVRAAFWSAGIELMQQEAVDNERDSMAALYRSAQAACRLHLEQPRGGDLVFFSARPSDEQQPPVQVAIVESVDTRGTITAVGQFADGPRRIRFNLRAPQQLIDGDGNRLNDLLAHGEQAALPAAALARVFADPF